MMMLYEEYLEACAFYGSIPCFSFKEYKKEFQYALYERLIIEESYNGNRSKPSS